jgi:hypothetical protein
MTRPADAISNALTRTQRVLFEPFDVAKYVALGFCVWLSQLGNVLGNSSGVGGRTRGNPSGGGAPGSWQEVLDQLAAWGPTIVAFATIGAVVGIAVWGVVLFLQSRGLFMVIDGVVRNRGEVVAPWSAWAPEANALFRFRFALHVGAAVIALLEAGVAGSAVWLTWEGSPTPLQVAILSALTLGVAVVGLVAGVADACAREFVAPMMYVRRYAVGDGFRDLWAYVRDDPGGFALYVVLRSAAAMLVAVLIGLLSRLTFGLALVPFLGTLLLLPALLFLRTCSLDFVAQLSDDLSALSGPTSRR